MTRDPRTLRCEDGATIAYHFTPGKSPGVVFLTGFMSDMDGAKALAVEAWAGARGRAFLRFDYTGHGASSGEFADGTIGRWAADAVLVLDRVAEGPQVLVGSSMGGWIMLLAAMARPERVAGLLGSAAAPDFTRDLLTSMLTADQRRTIEKDGLVLVSNDYGEAPYPISMTLIEEARNHMLLGSEIPIDCPVRLIHGLKDSDVPWETSQRLSESLGSNDVEVILVKDGDHRLSEDRDLARLTAVLESLIDRIGG
ncbi:MAG: alpha/beta hydrolase [Proteobacteria bacterium]|nr:alpha/beta hydrolase [Pseudomonadota bacterium]